jgi:hypothetical protein
MQHTPKAGSKKHLPSKSAPLGWGKGRSRVGGYKIVLRSGDKKSSSGMKGLKNHHTVPEIRVDE